MKVFFDTEFTGLHKNTTLISIGCVDEVGRTFYAELNDYDKSQCDDWIQRNVIQNLINDSNKISTKGNDWFVIGDKEYVAVAFSNWLKPYNNVQFVSDVCHYDMVLLIDLFGTAFDLPKGVSASCHDINQDIASYYGVSEAKAFDLSRENISDIIQGDKHNALYDARVIRSIYAKMNNVKFLNTPQSYLLDKKISDCNLSIRVKNICRQNGLETVKDVCRLHKVDWFKLRNSGKKSLCEIDDFLKDNGLDWGMNM